MIVIASAEERDLLTRLRSIGASPESATALSAEVLTLKRAIADLEINKAKLTEAHAAEEREHMIGLEKKRQEFEIQQAKREAVITVREEALKAEKERFTEQLAFNTARFEKMETYTTPEPTRLPMKPNRRGCVGA